MHELETEELRSIVRDNRRFAARLPVVVENEFRIEEIIEALKAVEAEFRGAELYVYCPSLLSQRKVDEPDPKSGSRAAAAGAVLHSMHLDTLPYSSVIVCVSREEGDALRHMLAEGGAEFEAITTL